MVDGAPRQPNNPQPEHCAEQQALFDHCTLPACCRLSAVLNTAYLSTYTHVPMSRLEAALAARFTDAQEIQDVVDYGCIAGVSGFIYNNELSRFFSEHQLDIEDLLNKCAVRLEYLVKDPSDWTFKEMRDSAVWFVVEDYCQRRLFQSEAEQLYALV